MRSLFCLRRVWYVWVAISLLLAQTVFAQNETNQSSNLEIMNDTVQIPLSENTITSTNESSTTDTTANVSVTQTNATGSETNETIPPSLLVDITYPEKVTRGQTIEVKAVITNTWPEISNVVTEWLLPQGFEILSKQENCNSLASNASCESVILLSSTNAELGLNQAKVVVNYG